MLVLGTLPLSPWAPPPDPLLLVVLVVVLVLGTLPLSPWGPPPDPLLDRRTAALNCAAGLALQGRLQPLALAQIFVSPARPFQPPSAPEHTYRRRTDAGSTVATSRSTRLRRRTGTGPRLCRTPGRRNFLLVAL